MTGALRSPAFRFLWVGQTVSTVGDRMIIVALALFVTQRTGSASDVGLVLAAYVVPMIVFLPLGGVWADRIPRRRLMIGSDLLRCATQAALALLITLGTVPLGLVMALEALCGAAQAFFRPAYTGLLPQTVPDEQIQSATSISSLSDTGASFVGPALATALIAAFGAGAVFFVDSASFAVSAILLLRVRSRPRGEGSPRTGVRRELRDGYRAVRTRTWVWVTLVTFSIAVCVGFAPYLVLGPTIAEQHYHHSNLFGVLATAMGAGSFAGALLGLRWRPRQPLKAGMIALVIWPPTFALFALGAPLGIVLAAMVLTGGAITLFEVLWDTTLIEHIPPEVLSRVSAWDWLGSVALMPVGYIAAGALASGVGADAILAVGAAIAAVLLVVGLIPEETRALTGGSQAPAGAAETRA
jgi:predicted MFS family arabinose efflux permease